MTTHRENRDNALYCVVVPTRNGPCVSFWEDAHIVLELMGRYLRNGCAPQATIWHRASNRKPWILITND